MTSAAKTPSAIVVAVRQTPLTATESPSLSSPASEVLHGQAHAVGRGVDGGDRAEVRDQPGEHAYHSRMRAVISTSSADARALQRERAHGGGDALGALALERVARARSAEHDRRDEQADLVDLARVQERAREVRAALQQDRRDARRAELDERVAHAVGLVGAGGDDHLGARDLQRVDRGPRRGAGDDDGQRHLGGAAHELGVQRQPGLGVEDDPARLARDAVDARRSAAGRRPARCRSRPRPRRPRRASGATSRRESSPEIHLESPVRVATLPSSVIADLKSTNGRPVRACLRNGWLSSRARRGELAVGDHRPRCPRRAGCPRPRPEAFSVGSSEAITTRAMPASRIASVHGGVRPVWQHGSSETYSVAPRRSAPPAGGDRRALGVRPAERGVEALAEHLPVAHDHRADERVRAGRARDRPRRARSPGRGARGRWPEACSRTHRRY